MSGHKKNKVLIVGLPLFAKKLKEDLQAFDPSNQYYCLDTYYNKLDKIKALFIIPFVDIVYSINGTLSESGVFDWAFKCKKRVMMTWVGTDVLKAKNELNKNQLYLKKAEHYCEVDWIKKELETIGIKAKIQNFFNFKSNLQITHLNEKYLNILSYISKNREEFYGWNELCYVAKRNSDVSFTVVGTDGVGEYPSNINCLGWQKNMELHFNKAHCTMRFVKHDGLSGFVLESLLRGKQVIYSQALNFCLHAKSKEEIDEKVKIIKQKLYDGNDLFNEKGRDYVLKNFNTDSILSTLVYNFNQQ